MAEASGRILIVDDEPPLLKMMQVYLKRLGFDVSVAGGTAQAWLEFQTAPASFAGVVLDATMPGLSLEELALRMLNANPGLFVIAASGYPVDMSALESASPGRTIFLHKPFAPEMLASAIRRMLAPQEEGL